MADLAASGNPLDDLSGTAGPRIGGQRPPAGEGNALDDLSGESSPEIGALQEAAAAEAQVDETSTYGRLGRPIDRQSPFWIGLTATFGVTAAATAVWAVYLSRQVLLLVVLSLFIAAGLEPAVAWLCRRGLARGWAVVVVVLAALAAFGGILDLVIPVVVTQVSQLINDLPSYSRQLNDRSSVIGNLNTRYHIEPAVQNYLQHGSAGGILGVGKAVFSALSSTVLVIVLSIYLLVDLPRLKRTIFSLAPRSRRARVVLIGEEIFSKVGAYVLGNVLISVITGVGTTLWCLALGIPFALLLGVLVAVLDLVPVVGSTIGGILVALLGLTVSVPVAGLTIAFYVAYRLIEDYLIGPRVMRRAVDVPGLLTVIATFVGAALLGIIGALIAIPVAAALNLLLSEVAFPRLEQS